MSSIMRPKLSYLICATPRSGSTLLCEALGKNGIAGYPAEHFEVLLETGHPRRPRDYFQHSNDPAVWALLDDPEFRDVLGDYGGRFAEAPDREDPSWQPPDFRQLLNCALEKGTTPNGVFGTKIMWAYFRDFVRLARRTGREGVEPCEVAASVFPNLRRYVFGSGAGTPCARRSHCGRRFNALARPRRGPLLRCARLPSCRPGRP